MRGRCCRRRSRRWAARISRPFRSRRRVVVANRPDLRRRRRRLAAFRGRRLHARHRLRREVVARRLHAAAGNLSDVRPRADAGAARHLDPERQLCVGHERRHAGAVHADVSRRRAVQHPPAARARADAARVRSRRRSRRPMPQRSRCRSSARPISACRSSAGR